MTIEQWMAEWGVGDPDASRGGLVEPHPAPSPREVHLLQRKATPIGKGLGKTTGWVHRAALKAKGVQHHVGVNYERIDDAGLHITHGEDRTDPQVLDVDTIVLCTGQESVNTLGPELAAARRHGARHRRRRRRGRARRQARHPPGHRARRARSETTVECSVPQRVKVAVDEAGGVAGAVLGAHPLTEGVCRRAGPR